MFRAGLALLLCGLPLLSGVPAQAGEHPSSQVVFEVGYVQPHGDLADDFFNSPLGFGIKEGLELGFRWRYRFSESLSISPSFHFVDYRNFSGENEEVGAYRIKPTTMRYSLELMYIMLKADTPVRPFIAGSAGIVRNRVEGYWKTWDKAFDSSVNALGFGLRAGLLVGGFEFSAVYNVNRFDTWRFFNTGYEESYVWDNAVLRVGWIIPFND
ncbi:MAG: outer membrane beta-barrel protein [Candidatus Krumholzibacteria bacterium]|nr:outer membrane beta-barrel protein [Candidatus Krumholzibacteria bacterium]